jgi:hypothetical protein
MPKFVFKPLEFFQVETMNAISKISDTKANRPHIKNIEENSKAGWFLTGIGQETLKQFSKPRNIDHKGAMVDLRYVCLNLTEAFERVKPLFISGFVDRYDNVGGVNVRDILSEQGYISNTDLTVEPNANTKVFGNEPIITMHIWNVLENALIHSEIMLSRTQNLISIDIKNIGTDSSRVLVQIKSENSSMKVPILNSLNRLFSTRSSTKKFSMVEVELKKLVGSIYDSSGFQNESRGRGLIRFAQYLDALWRSVDNNQNAINGDFVLNKQQLTASFYFPKYVDN